MKKFLYAIILSIILPGMAFSQDQAPPPLPGAKPSVGSAKGFYIRANAGFAFAHGVSTLGHEITFISEGNYRYQNIDGSLGRGINVEGGIGYMFNEHIGADLSVLYQFGLNYEFTQVPTIYPIPQQSPYETDLRGSMLAFTPSAILTTGANKKVVPYIKLGVLVAIPAIAQVETFSDTKLEKKTVYSGGVELGFTGSLGVEFKLNEKLNIYGEVKLNSLSYSPSRSEIVTWEENGRNVLPDKLTTEKKKELVEFITTKTRTDNEELTRSHPFSSLGINIGVKFKLFN